MFFSMKFVKIDELNNLINHTIFKADSLYYLLAASFLKLTYNDDI